MEASALLLLLLLSGTALPPTAHACTSIIVGKKASADGSVFIARNVDYPADANITNRLFWHAPRSEPLLFRSNLNGFETELPGNAPGYVAWPRFGVDATDGSSISYEEVGVNDFGVAVSSTETIESSEAALTFDPLNNETGITEDDVPSIILPLPTATSARQAAAALGEAIEELGSAEGFGILFSDTQLNAWYLENAAGHHWLAQRIPDNKFFVSANQGRFQEVDLSDNENVLSSPGLAEFAADTGLWDPANGTFNFFKAFMEDGWRDPLANYIRVCILTQLYTDMDNSTCMGLMPSSLPVFQTPVRPLSLGDVKEGLRNYYQGSEHDPYTNQNPQEQWRPIFVLRTGHAHVVQTREGVPDGLSVIQHVALGPPALTPFVPVYRGLQPDDYPPELTQFGAEMDAQSLFWKARRVQALVMQDFAALAPGVQDAIAGFEQDVEEVQQPAFEKGYTAAIDAKDQKKADKLVAEFTANVVARACAMLDQQLQKLTEALGMNSVPDDALLSDMIEEATATYGLHGPTQETQGI